MNEAVAEGINGTMAACVSTSKSTVHVITGILQGSIEIVEFAHGRQGRIAGKWGSASVEYAIWEEIGTSHRPGHPYLRPSADRHYPELARRIKAAFLRRAKAR